LDNQTQLKVRRISFKDKTYFSNDTSYKEEIIPVSSVSQERHWTIKKQAYTNNTNINYHTNCDNINYGIAVSELPPNEFVIYLDVHGYIDETPQCRTMWRQKDLSEKLDDDVNIIYLASAGNMTSEVHKFIFRYIIYTCYESDGYVLDNNGCPSETLKNIKKHVRTTEGKKWLKEKTQIQNDIFINNLSRIINTIHLNPPCSVINTQYLTLEPSIKFDTIHVENRISKSITTRVIPLSAFIPIKKSKNMYIGEFIKIFKQFIKQTVRDENIRFTFISGACRQEYHRTHILPPTISRQKSINIRNSLSSKRENTKRKQANYYKILSYLVMNFGPRREKIKSFINNIDIEHSNKLFELLNKMGSRNNYSEINIEELKIFILEKIKNKNLLKQIKNRLPKKKRY
jgi:hypothetical protein